MRLGDRPSRPKFGTLSKIPSHRLRCRLPPPPPRVHARTRPDRVRRLLNVLCSTANALSKCGFAQFRFDPLFGNHNSRWLVNGVLSNSARKPHRRSDSPVYVVQCQAPSMCSTRIGFISVRMVRLFDSRFHFMGSQTIGSHTVDVTHTRVERDTKCDNNNNKKILSTQISGYMENRLIK